MDGNIGYTIVFGIAAMYLAVLGILEPLFLPRRIKTIGILEKYRTWQKTNGQIKKLGQYDGKNGSVDWKICYEFTGNDGETVQGECSGNSRHEIPDKPGDTMKIWVNGDKPKERVTEVELRERGYLEEETGELISKKLMYRIVLKNIALLLLSVVAAVYIDHYLPFSAGRITMIYIAAAVVLMVAGGLYE